MVNKAMTEQLLSGTFFQELLQEIPVGIVYALWSKSPDEGGELLYCGFNKEAGALLSLNQNADCYQQAIAFPFSLDKELISSSPNLSPSHSPMESLLKGHNLHRRDLIAGSTPISLFGKQLQTGSGYVCMALLQLRDHRLFNAEQAKADLTTSEISISDTLRFGRLITTLSTDLLSATTPESQAEHIHQALRAIGKFCQTDRVYVMEFDEAVTSFSNTHEWVREGITAHIDELQNIPADELPWFFKKIKQESLFVIHDINDLPVDAGKERSEFEREDIQSVICIGIYAKGRLAGFVGCDMVARKRYWTESDIRRIRTVGNLVFGSISGG